jgi:hypothetical protein
MPDMKDILDKAASSSDARIRHFAIEYKLAQQKLEQYNAFFELYGENSAEQPSTAPSSPSMKLVGVKTRGRRPASGNNTFVPVVVAILNAAGGPMQLPKMHELYLQQNPGHAIAFETFRQKVIGRKDSFYSIRGQGYWLKGHEVPENAAA